MNFKRSVTVVISATAILVAQATSTFLLAAAVAVSASAATPPKLMDKESSCVLLKKREAVASKLPESGPVGMGWFCDFGSFDDARDDQWFLIALRSNQKCDGICSNLMGWFAIDRRDGTIHSCDMGEFEVGPPIKYGK